MKIKYVFKQTVVGWNWHPVINDQVLFYPHGDLRGVQQFVNEHISAIEEYVNSDDNYGRNHNWKHCNIFRFRN